MTTMLLTDQQQKRQKTEIVLRNIFNLSSIPKVTSEVLKLLEQKNVNNAELSKLISRDMGLVSKILAIANSPMYGLRRRVTSVDFALLILGISELKSIISVLSISEAFKNKSDKYLDQKDLWLHSFLVGTAAKRLAEDLKYYNSGEAFIGGFLHDMGISIIHRYFHTNFIQIHELITQKGYSMRSAEFETIGMDHQQIGSFLLERWNFPIDLSDAVLHHHNPGQAAQEDKMLSAIIHFSDYMINKMEIGNAYWDNDVQLDKEAIQVMQFKSDEEIERFVEGYKTLCTEQLESIKYLG